MSYYLFIITQSLLLTTDMGRNQYLDPGSGSYLLQLLLAALLGSAFLIKTYWKKIKQTIRRIFTKSYEEIESDGE